MPLDHVHYIQQTILSESISAIYYRAVTNIFLSGLNFGNRIFGFVIVPLSPLGLDCKIYKDLSEEIQDYNKKPFANLIFVMDYRT